MPGHSESSSSLTRKKAPLASSLPKRRSWSKRPTCWPFRSMWNSLPASVAQALEAGKLFHIDLNGQQVGRFDQDLRFGSDDAKGAFFLVKLLEDSEWPGMRHFDSHAYRTEDQAGVWDFAAGSMRTYLILKDKVARFNADPEIQQLLAEADGGKAGARVAFNELRNTKFDLAALRARGYAYERLDQLTMELLLGVR